MVNEDERTAIEANYGKLFALDAKGNRLTLFNEQGFARLYHALEKPIYLSQESAFYLYEPTTGLWKIRSKEEMLDRLSLFLHECAETWGIWQLDEKRKSSALSGILRFLSTASAAPGFFKHTERIFIHCANGVLELDSTKKWVLRSFSPAYHSRNRCEIMYQPGADCPRFRTELLHPLMTNDDEKLIQQYIGQCLTGRNITQSILLLTGSGGSGKGTLANITEGLVGEGNYTQIRPQNITGRFETSFFMDKTLLTGKESNTSFFSASGMQVLKSLVGDDKMRAELKNSNRHAMIDGVYNVLIVGNPTPILDFESAEDRSAWYRRLRWIKCKEYKPAIPIVDFAKKLLASEGSGILNWALEGAATILNSGNSSLPCDELQKARLNYLFQAAEPLDFFLSTLVEKKHGVTITGDELFQAFTEVAQNMHWATWPLRRFQKELPDAMLQHFGTPLRRDVQRLNANGKMTNRSGYFHVAFKQ